MFNFLFHPKETELEIMDRELSWAEVAGSFQNVILNSKALAHCLVALGVITFIKLASIQEE